MSEYMAFEKKNYYVAYQAILQKYSDDIRYRNQLGYPLCPDHDRTNG